MERAPVPEGVVRPPGVEDDAILRIFAVPHEASGTRLDVFLQSRLRRTSRTRTRRIIEKSAYSPGGERLRPNDRVRSGQLIAIWRPAFEVDEEQPPLPILYQDADLLVIDKPPLVAVHPSARYHRHTVIVRLAEERPGEFLALVHRLDRETSGILMLARNPSAEKAFKRALEQRSLVGEGAVSSEPQMDKEYLAIVTGEPPSESIDLPVELDPESTLAVKMRIAAPESGLWARTDVTVLERRAGYSLLRCALHTGRQHQIRVHLAARGCPVVGDKLYGPDERLLARGVDGQLSEQDRALLELPRHALHAHRYHLDHAVSHRPLTLVSPLSDDLADFWRKLG